MASRNVRKTRTPGADPMPITWFPWNWWWLESCSLKHPAPMEAIKWLLKRGSKKLFMHLVFCECDQQCTHIYAQLHAVLLQKCFSWVRFCTTTISGRADHTFSVVFFLNKVSCGMNESLCLSRPRPRPPEGDALHRTKIKLYFNAGRLYISLWQTSSKRKFVAKWLETRSDKNRR